MFIITLTYEKIYKRTYYFLKFSLIIGLQGLIYYHHWIIMTIIHIHVVK